jgi:hypothetical protein
MNSDEWIIFSATDTADLVSECCEAEVRMSDQKVRRGQTVFYVCGECEEACDAEKQEK